MKQICRALIFVLVAIGPSHATPPQIVQVEDRLSGANETHVFLLRTLSDNRGQHHLELTDTVLVAKRIDTGADDEVWPVRRVLDNGPYFADYGLAERVEILPIVGQVNPFDILAERKAWPMTDGPGTTGFAAAFTEQSLVVTDTVENTTQYRIGFAALAAQMTASLNSTRSALPAHFNEGGVDALENLQFDIKRDCEVISTNSHFVRQEWRALFVKIHCLDDEIVQPTGLYVVLQPTKH